MKRLAIFNLLLAFAIILWGAWVRISGSGDGCGAHWPLCKGELWPSLMSVETWIELFHRIKSGLFGITVIIVFVLSRIHFSKNHPARHAAFWGLFFSITEALIGAKLVLFDLVGENQSLQRVITSALHLSNTSILMGALVATVLWSRDSKMFSPKPWKASAFRFLILFVCIGVTGTWAALSNTLFPSSSLQDGLAADFSSTSHWLVQIRITHPIIAVIFGSYIWIKLLKHSREISDKTVVLLTKICIPLTVIIGLITLTLLSPTWLKLTHLAFSTLSITLIWCVLFWQRD